MTQKTVSRLTGLAYFGMLPAGIAFMTLRAQILGATAGATLANLVAHPETARLELAATMGIIVTQALAALGFYALYRESRPTAGFGVAGFGLVNCAAILVGSAATWTALELSAAGASADQVHGLLLLDGNAWNLGNLFFGLWLIPMGAGAAGLFRAGRWLGGVLVAGGVAYVAGAFAALSPTLVAAGIPAWCSAPATVGELWMIGALLVGAKQDGASADGGAS